jgi:hypothetical protein
MSELNQLERDVEQARQKLVTDLARLRSPEAMSSFKDDVIGQTREAARTTAEQWLDDLKRRAVANPVAALAIGAGIAWRLARHPPIASVLVGLGVVGLMRTNPQQGSPDYARRAAELAAAAQGKLEHWSAGARGAAAHAGEGAESMKQTVREWSTAAGDAAQEAASRIASTARRGMDGASRSLSAAPVPDRDAYLLGAAALAVAAACGISYQRRTG